MKVVQPRATVWRSVARLGHSNRRLARRRCERVVRRLDPRRATTEPDIEFIEDTEEEIDYGLLRKVNLVDAKPGMMQQTLWRSFTVGGIGLHSGEVAYVRVRPAFAGDGRYFVRVPEGTNKEFASHTVDEEIHVYPKGTYALDEDAEVLRSELFLKYLEYKEREGYTGDFSKFIVDYSELKGFGLDIEECIMDREEAAPKTKFDKIIPATLKSLANEEPLYETSLENHKGHRVESVEHLLAALEACGVDNARIEIEGGPEVPIVDGSSLGWVIEIEKMGVTLAQCGDGTEDFYVRAARKPDEVVRVQDGDAFIILIPGDKMRVTYGIDHTHECPLIGAQWFSYCFQEDQHFRMHLAAAKTYVTNPDDLYVMRDQGFMKAGSEQVVLIGNGYEWHDETLLSYVFDEPVRHKILDLIGDLALLGEEGMGGLPFGHIIAFKADHALHHAFAKKIREKYNQCYEQYTKVKEEPVEYEEEPEDEDLEADLEGLEAEDIDEENDQTESEQQ